MMYLILISFVVFIILSLQKSDSKNNYFVCAASLTVLIAAWIAALVTHNWWVIVAMLYIATILYTIIVYQSSWIGHSLLNRKICERRWKRREYDPHYSPDAGPIKKLMAVRLMTSIVLHSAIIVCAYSMLRADKLLDRTVLAPVVVFSILIIGLISFYSIKMLKEWMDKL